VSEGGSAFRATGIMSREEGVREGRGMTAGDSGASAWEEDRVMSGRDGDDKGRRG
jgi:hypothetical protein